MNKLLRFLRGHRPDVNALSARLDGELDASAAARLDEHVASCDACRGVGDGLRATRDALRAMPEAPLPRTFRLRAADVERRAERPVVVAGVARWAPGAMAAAAVAIAVVGAYVTFGGGRDSGSPQLAASRAPTAATEGMLAADRANVGANKSAPGPSGGIAPPVAGSPAAALAATPPLPASAAAQSATDSATTAADNAFQTPVEQLAPLSGSSTPAPSAPRQAEAPAATPTSELQAAAGGASDDDGNKPAVVIVVVIAAIIALGAGVAAIGWWRRRGAQS